jgi:regulator of sigma E protease
MFVFYILIAVAILLLMIVIHEFGHYIAGKAMGFRINEFSIGFGPIIYSRTLRNGEKFSLRAIPLGGFCAFYDEDGTGDKSATQGSVAYKSFVQHKPYQRIVVLLAGALFNFVSAFVFALIFVWVVGYSVPTVNSLAFDANGQPYASQLQVGDTIESVDGKRLGVLYSWTDALNSNRADNASFELTVLRDDVNDVPTRVVVTVHRQSIVDEYGNTHLGIGFNAGSLQMHVGLWDSVVNCVPLTFKFGGMILGSFGDMLTGNVPLTEISGPLSTVTSIAQSATINAQVLLLMLPLIAANLAIFNLLPIPALDGGRIVFVIVEWIRGKPISRDIESIIHFAGFVLLMGGVILLEIVKAIV